MIGAGPAGLVGVALAHGLALAVMISAFGATSGGHFNPAVTLGFWVTGRQSFPSTARYWMAQLLGAVVASAMVRWIFPGEVWKAVALGAPALHPGLSVGMGLAVEFTLTFILVTVVWGTAVDSRGPGLIAGFAIGLTVAMDILMGGPLTGAAMNPARAFGAAVLSGTFAHHWIYWAGPLLGGAAAALLYSSVVLKQK
jgi:MIP family channel proteins